MILILIPIIALLYYVLNTVYCRSWNRNLKVQLSFADPYIYEGENSVLLETIENAKRIPLPTLQVRFQVNRNLEFLDAENTSVTDLCYKRDVFSVSFYQKITRTLKFNGAHRGYYPIDVLTLEAQDLFMLRNLLHESPQDIGIYVYPKRIDAREIEIPFQKIMGTLLHRQFLYEDPFEMRGIRDYVSTDSMNSINWNASAKTGDLMVNVHDSTASQEVVLFLDVEDETVWKYPQLHEAGIQIAASLAELLLFEGIHLSIICNGKDGILKEIISVPPGNGKHQINCIHQCLARIDLKLHADSFEKVLEEQTKYYGGVDPFYILISKNQRVSLWEEFNRLLENGQNGLWVVPLHNDMELELRENARVQIHRWEVSK